MDYAVRLTFPYEGLKGFFDYVNEKTTHWIAYEHPIPGNIHVHALLLGCTVDDDTLKYQVKKALDVKTVKRTQWSFKTTWKCKKTGEVFPVNMEHSPKFITYMSKGIYDPKGFKGWTQEYIDERKGAWVAPPSKAKDLGLSKDIKITYTTIQETPKQKRKRKIDLLVEMETLVSQQILELRKDDIDYNPTTRQKFRMFYESFVKVCNDNHEFITKYKFEEYYTTFLCRENGEAMANVAQEVFSKLFSKGLV